MKMAHSKKLVARGDYYKWVDGNDSYPEHSHQFVVMAYTEERPDQLYRVFGPFQSYGDADAWFRDYRDKYTDTGFIKKFSIVPMCEVKND